MPLSSTSQAFPVSTFSNQSASVQPSNMDSRTGKDGTYWSSTSSPQGRFRSHNVIQSRLSIVLSPEVYTPKSAFELFISANIVQEILLCTNLQGWGVSQEWKHVSKEEFMVFIRVLLLAGAEKKLACRSLAAVLRPPKNSANKVAFGISRFENIRCQIRFDDKQTRAAQLKQDKLTAFSFV